MTALLALDTADRTAGVAVARGGEVLAAVVGVTHRRHGTRLLGLVDACLTGAGVERADIAAVACTVGPGSFTGLRVGLATANGLSAALGVPTAGVSTLEALARSAMPFPGTVVPLLDAKKRQVYGAVLDGRTGRRSAPEAAWDPGVLAAAAAGAGGDVLLLGSGIGPYRDVFAAALGGRAVFAPEWRWAIPPAQVAVLASAALERGEEAPPGGLAPVYCRRSEAEERRAG